MAYILCVLNTKCTFHSLFLGAILPAEIWSISYINLLPPDFFLTSAMIDSGTVCNGMIFLAHFINFCSLMIIVRHISYSLLTELIVSSYLDVALRAQSLLLSGKFVRQMQSLMIFLKFHWTLYFWQILHVHSKAWCSVSHLYIFILKIANPTASYLSVSGSRLCDYGRVTNS